VFALRLHAGAVVYPLEGACVGALSAIARAHWNVNVAHEHRKAILIAPQSMYRWRTEEQEGIPIGLDDPVVFLERESTFDFERYYI